MCKGEHFAVIDRLLSKCLYMSGSEELRNVLSLLMQLCDLLMVVKKKHIEKNAVTCMIEIWNQELFVFS